MASLKGGDYLFNGSIANNAVSTLVNIGPGPWVALYITNTSAITPTFKIQVATTASPQAGRNALSSAADGGLTWFDYIPQGLSATPAISVAQNAAICYELSPFGPNFIRLLRTDALGAANVVAMVSSFGPN